MAKPFQVRVTDLKEETANVTSPRDEAETKKNKNWKVILFLFLSYSYFISLISGTIPAVGPRTLCMLGSSTTEPLSRAPHWCTPGALLIHAVRTFFTGTPPLGQNSNPTILFVAFSASETLPQKTIFFFWVNACLDRLSALPEAARRGRHIPLELRLQAVGCESPNVGAGTPTQSSEKAMYTLNH